MFFRYLKCRIVADSVIFFPIPLPILPLLFIFHYSHLPLLLDQGIASEAHSLIVQKIYTTNLWVFHLLCVQGLMEGRFFSILFGKCTLELSIKLTIYGLRVSGLGETEHNMLNKAWISTKWKSQGSKPRNPPKWEVAKASSCVFVHRILLHMWCCICKLSWKQVQH